MDIEHNLLYSRVEIQIIVFINLKLIIKKRKGDFSNLLTIWKIKIMEMAKTLMFN